jgi:hypothetical protein
LVGSAAGLAARTGAAAAASQPEATDGRPAPLVRRGQRPLWELGAASSSGEERADLVSPTVLPQLSASERQVRTL